MKDVRIELTDEEHRALRIAAAKAGVSMREFVKQVTLQVIAELEKEDEDKQP